MAFGTSCAGIRFRSGSKETVVCSLRKSLFTKELFPFVCLIFFFIYCEKITHDTTKPWFEADSLRVFSTVGEGLGSRQKLLHWASLDRRRMVEHCAVGLHPVHPGRFRQSPVPGWETQLCLRVRRRRWRRRRVRAQQALLH